MFRISGFLVVLIASVLFLVVPATYAQPMSPISMNISVGAIGGTTILQGDASNVFNNGYHLGGLAWVSFGQFGVRGDATYHKMKVPSTGALGATKASGDLKLTGFLVSGTYFLLPTPIIKPYAILGVGSFKVKSRFTDTPNTDYTENSSTNFAIAGGGGAKLQAGKVGAFLEVRYLRISTSGQATKSVLVSGGLLFALL